MTQAPQLVVARFPHPEREGEFVWRAAELYRANGVAVPCGYCVPEEGKVTCRGHETSDQALAHHARFLVEQRTLFDTSETRPCAVCQQAATREAYIAGMPNRYLCDVHRQKAALIALLYHELKQSTPHRLASIG